jgi:hypothetical protein
MPAPEKPTNRRRTRTRGVLLGVSLLAAFVACAQPRAPQASGEVKCVDHWAEARYQNYGYDHIVHLLSNCRTEVVCLVSTNVSPKALRVELPSGAEVEVLTYRGSPSREFTPNVRCDFPRVASLPARMATDDR